MLQLPLKLISNPSFSLTNKSLENGMFQTVLKEYSGLTDFPTMDLETECCSYESYTTNNEVNMSEFNAEHCLLSIFSR